MTLETGPLLTPAISTPHEEVLATLGPALKAAAGALAENLPEGWVLELVDISGTYFKVRVDIPGERSVYAQVYALAYTDK